MYRKETIAAAYKGAGFKIIRRAHLPPTLVSSQLLESSLEPNWLPPMDTMADEWDLIKEWAFGTVKRMRLLILPSLNNCLTKTPLQVRIYSK